MLLGEQTKQRNARRCLGSAKSLAAGFGYKCVVKPPSGIVYLQSPQLFREGTEEGAWRAPCWLELQQGDEKEDRKDNGVQGLWKIEHDCNNGPWTLHRGLVVLEVWMKLKNYSSWNTATIPTVLSIGIDWF